MLGSWLSVSPGTWSSAQPPTYDYQWQRCDSGGRSCIAVFGNESVSRRNVAHAVGRSSSGALRSAAMRDGVAK